jgi:hypothetical protein
MPNRQSQIWGEILVLKPESAGVKKVGIKALTTSRLYGARLCIIQYVKYNSVHTSTYQYILVCTQLSHDFCHSSAILLYLHSPRSSGAMCIGMCDLLVHDCL